MGRKRKKKRGRSGPGFFSRIGSVLTSFVRGEDYEEEETSEHLQEIKGIALIGFAIWIFLSMATYYDLSAAPPATANWGGRLGNYAARWVFLGFGWSGFCLCFLAVAWGLVLLARKHVTWPSLRLFGGACFLVTSSLWLELAFGASFQDSATMPYGVGGYLAKQVVGDLVEQFGNPGLWILLSLSVVISFMLATQMAFYPAIAAFGEWLEERREEDGLGVGEALWGWTKRLATGLWGFLSGSDVEKVRELKPASRKALPAPKKGAKKRAGKKAAAEPELFEEEEEYEEDDPAAEADDAEWEYVDEDGNPISAAELEEYDEEEEEEEEEPEGEYAEDEEYEDEDEEEWEEEDEEEPAEVSETSAAARPAAKKSRAALAIPSAADFEPPTPPTGDWKFPPISLLEPPGDSSSEDAKAIELAARKLEHALSSFRVESQVVHAQVGPAVTMYELEVSQGTRMNKVTQLSQEIAAALRAKSVRIIAPIPGRSTIGIEVPNKSRRIVRLSELISQQAYDKKFAALPMFIGMDAEGNAIVEDLARMPHLLIAGTTGSGKSVCISSILCSILLTRSPHDVQLILVDPKMVELQMFANVPHMMLPVVTDMKQATAVLLWAVEKMEGRYELFKNAGVRNIKSYNGLGEEKLKERMGENWNEERTPRHVPYIVIVIDEMADLMMTSKKEAEQAITRLAQKSRAVGVHVIVATQRPSTDVITGVLKGNLPTRIAFQVASKIDSRVILDQSGAEKLLGGGDMLYTPPQSSQIRRVQGALVEDEEIQGSVGFVGQESVPTFSQELIQATTGTHAAGHEPGSAADQDDLFDEAVRVILKTKRGSASLLQRALGIGYTRASRLIDLMAAEGIVGEHKGSKAREILMTIEDWEEMHGTPMGQAASDE
jgi:S-DNA-T family DNA segregation ATPase FtsK/SpoIIIE